MWKIVIGVKSKEKRFKNKLPRRRSGPLLSCFILLFARTMGLSAEHPKELSEATQALYQGDSVKAVSLAEAYVKAHPKAPAGRVVLAQVRMAQQDYEAAYSELREALRLDPKNLDALYHFGKLCAILSQLEFQELFAIAPDSYRVHQLMAEAHLAQQDTVKAEEAYKAALKANPKSVAVLTALGDLKRTELSFDQPGSSDSLAAARFDEAISYYSRALEIDPRNYDSLYGLGVSHLYRNETEKAIECFRRALASDPDSAVARLALGRALLSTKRPAEAAKELEAAAALQPNMRQAYFLLGRAYRQLGRAGDAKQAFEKEQRLRQAEFQAAQDAFFSDDVIRTPSSRPSANPEN